MSGILAFLGGGKFWLIGIAATALVAYGLGWSSGASHIARINSAELAKVADAAKSAQAKQDARDYAVARHDLETRAINNEARAKALSEKLKQKKIENPCKTKVSIKDMKALNDPAIVGETK